MAKQPSLASTCSVDSMCDNDSGVWLEFVPHLSSTLTNEIPDSVLLLSLVGGANTVDVPAPDPCLSVTPPVQEDNVPSPIPEDNIPSPVDYVPLSVSNNNVQSFVDNGPHSTATFSESDISKERETIQAIHSTFCHNRQPLFKLYDAINNKLGDASPFISNAGFEAFVKARSFLFEIGEFVRNRGYGYREGIRAIAHYVDEKCSNGESCILRDIFDNVVSNLPIYQADDPTVPWDDSWFCETPMSVDDLVQLLSTEHQELFHVQNTETGDPSLMSVRLTYNAHTTPSLWSDDCLPPKPGALLWDESRVYSFNASVTYVHEHHGLAVVQSGTFRGRLVYIHRSRIGPSDLRRNLHIGALVYVTAHITLNTTSQFRALSLSIINNFPTLEVKKIGPGRQAEREFSDFRGFVTMISATLSVTVPPPPIRRVENVHAAFSNQFRQLLRRAAESEKQMIAFADDLIAGNMYSYDGLQRRLVKYKYHHRITPFATIDDLEFFLCQRPHLYNFHPTGGAYCADEQQREVAIAFIEMISEFGFMGAPKQELRNRLMNSDSPLKSIMEGGTLDEYIFKISPLLEIVRVINPIEEMVMLRGTYIKEEKLFVHHFKASFLPTDRPLPELRQSVPQQFS